MLINFPSESNWILGTQNLRGRDSTKQKPGGAAGHCAVHRPSQHLVARASAGPRPAWARIRLLTKNQSNRLRRLSTGHFPYMYEDWDSMPAQRKTRCLHFV